MNGRNLLIDSNIIIYLSQKQLTLDAFASINDELFISDITYLETLGFPFVNDADKNFMIELLSQFNRIGLTESIIQATLEMKQNYKIKLPDAIIAATAKVRKMILVTRNIKDFERFDLLISNPM